MALPFGARRLSLRYRVPLLRLCFLAALVRTVSPRVNTMMITSNAFCFHPHVGQLEIRSSISDISILNLNVCQLQIPIRTLALPSPSILPSPPSSSIILACGVSASYTSMGSFSPPLHSPPLYPLFSFNRGDAAVFLLPSATPHVALRSNAPNSLFSPSKTSRKLVEAGKNPKPTANDEAAFSYDEATRLAPHEPCVSWRSPLWRSRLIRRNTSHGRANWHVAGKLPAAKEELSTRCASIL